MKRKNLLKVKTEKRFINAKNLSSAFSYVLSFSIPITLAGLTATLMACEDQGKSTRSIDAASASSSGLPLAPAPVDVQDPPAPTPSNTATPPVTSPTPTASATPTPPPAPTPVTGSNEDPCQDQEHTTDREEICRLVNIERVKHGLGVLELNPVLVAISQAYSEKMSSEGFLNHTSPDGSTMTSRLHSGGAAYSWAGENIAHGQAGPAEVMNSWMNSSGHRANILNSHYKKIGIGSMQRYWVQDFTN
jgi:uncharacterized protein YkwD